MSFAGRLIHSLDIVRTPFDTEDLDDWGQPVPQEPVRVSVKGLVQPKSVKEVALSHQAGAEISSHVIFLPLVDIIAADAIEYADERYEVVGVRRYAFGTAPHLEVDARRVSGDARIVEAGS